MITELSAILLYYLFRKIYKVSREIVTHARLMTVRNDDQSYIDESHGT